MTGATKRDRGKLGGLNHRKAVRLLAAGELTQAAVAERMGVSQSAVSQFRDRYAEEIREVAADMDNEFAGIAIADKVNRVAMYSEIAERALVPVPKVAANGKTVTVINPETGEPEMVMEFNGALAGQMGKLAAEEMGQLASRLQVSGDMQTTTTYKIIGVDPESMK